MQIIGIDPGLSGALASIINGELAAVHDLPVCLNGLNGRFKHWIDTAALASILRECCEGQDKPGILFVVERPIAMPGQDSGGTAATFDTFGAIRGIVGSRHARIEFVVPRRWKRAFGLLQQPGTKDSVVKRASIDTALKFFPLAPIEKAKHHNRAEAVLIARWGWQTFAA